MKVTLFGATGKVGKHIVVECLRLGHELTVYTRQSQPSVGTARVVQGELNDAEKITEAIDGAHVVVSALANRDYASALQVVAPFVQLAAGRIQPAQRLIIVAGSGLMLASFNQLRRDLPGQPEHLKNQRADHWDAYCKIAPLDINYLFVCPTMIVEGESNEKYLAKEKYFPESQSRQIRAGNVAHYIAREIADGTLQRTRVGLVGSADEEE